MALPFIGLLFTAFLVPGTWQQEWPPFPLNGCRHEKDTTLCVSKVYCEGYIDISWDQNILNECGKNYWNNNQFGETVYTLKHIHTHSDTILSDNYAAYIITQLDLSFNDYSDAPKIALMEHLNSLNFSGNSLTRAKLYNHYELKELSEIDLSHNTINSIDVDVEEKVYRKLRKINLAHNYLVVLQEGIFDYFPELEFLDLSYNFIDQLSIITFEGMKNLVYLNLQHNRLSDLHSSLFRFSKLIELYLNANKIKNVKETNFEKLTSLKILDLSSNLITEIEENAFSNTHSLETLNLHNNLLENVKKEIFANISTMKHVDLSNNRFTFLTKDLFKDKRISQFSITGNNLEGSLVKGTFEGLKLITNLDLSNQQFTSIEDFAFYGLEYLKELFLNNNSLRTLSKKSFNTLRSLETLDLSHNQLVHIEFDKDELVSLRSLLLQNNLLIQVKHEFFNGLNNLQFLDLSSNNITQLETNSFHTLKDLINFQISNNPINGELAESTFEGLNSLPSLDISGTLLTTIKNGSFNGMVQLRELNASHSNISELQYNLFLRTGLIEIIDLSFNKLIHFDINTTEIVNLDKLILNNNLFSTISSTSLKGLPRLTNIILSHNQIITIHDEGFEDQKDVRYLDLSYNPTLRLDISRLVKAQNLVSVHLSGILTNITFNCVKEMGLSRLEMSHSNISNITSVGLQKLKNLDYLVLSNNNINQIDTVAFIGVKNLRELDLSYNKITLIQPGAFKDNTFLRFLNISNNWLTAINYGIFRGLIYLDTVDISYNEISDLKSERFYEVRSLTVLVADHNKINNINSDDFFGTNLKKLSIGDNPIPCHILVNLKKANTEFDITALRLDESSGAENIDGVTCNMDTSVVQTIPRTYNVSNERILYEIKDILLNMSSDKINISSFVPIQTNYFKHFTNIVDKIDEINSNLNLTLVQGNHNNSLLLEKLSSTLTSTLIEGNRNTNTLLEKIVKILSTSKRTDPIPIPPLPKDNITAENLIPYINKIKQDLEDAMTVERQNIYDEMDKKISRKLLVTNPPTVTSIATAKPSHEAYSSNSSNDNLNSESVIFIEVCVGLILVLMVAVILYNFYNSGMFVPNRRSSSSRHLPDAIDNSVL